MSASSPQAREVIEAKRRLISLERRFRDMAGDAVKYLHQLLDVDISYDGAEAVLDGDVLTYDDEEKMWVARTGGTGGAYGSARAIGTWTTGVFGDYEVPWALESAEEFALEGLVSDDGLVVGAAGIYHASASAWTDDGSSEIELRVLVGDPVGWQLDGEEGECHPHLQAIDQGAGSASAGLDFPLAEGASVRVDIDCSDSVTWVLTVHLVHPAQVIEGACDE